MSWRTGMIVAAVLGLCTSTQATSLPIVRQFAAPDDTPEGLTFVDGDLWIWGVGRPSMFSIVDPENGDLRNQYMGPYTGGPNGLDYDGQYVYGVSGLGSEIPFFARFDPKDGSVLEYFDLPVASPTGITFGGGYLWISETDGHQLVKMNPSTMEVVQTFVKEPYTSLDMAYDGQYLWLMHYVFDVGNYISRIDPATGITLNTYDASGPESGGIAFKDGLLYVSDATDDMIYVLQIPEPTMLSLLPLVMIILLSPHTVCYDRRR